jgi:hypothetical protein
VCEDIARRCSLGCTDLAGVVVRSRAGGQVCGWWVRGRRSDKAPVPAANHPRHGLQLLVACAALTVVAAVLVAAVFCR